MLELKNIYKTYRTKNGVTHRALHNVSLNFESKGLVFIVGKSGSGKSTLLNMLGALDGYERGEVIIDGRSLNNFTKEERDAYRNTIIGFIFQEYNLIETLTVKENIGLALSLQHIEDNNRIAEVIKRLDLGDLEKRKPHELSGGQQQRVSIARALVKDPKIILADEPTGSLDTKTGEEIFKILKELSKEKLVIVITHDRDNAEEIGDRVIEIKDGIIYKDLIKLDKAIETQNIDVVGSSIIRIPKEREIDDTTVDKINDIVLHNGKDNYIIFEQNSTKVKSMFPQLRNAIVDKSQKDITNFIPYSKKEEEIKNFQYVKSSLPLKSGFKISLNNLKYKKIRLTFTIIMMIIALTLMGLISALNNYDYARAFNKTIVKENIPNVLINQVSNYDNQNEFSEKDIEELKKVYKGPISYHFPKTFLPSTIIDNNFTTLYDMKGYTEIENVVDIGMAVEYGSDILDDFDSVIITDYYASKLLDYNMAENTEGLINKVIKCDGKDLKIVGILKTDYHKYDILNTPMTDESAFEYDKRSSLQNHLEIQDKNLFSIAYVKKGYLERVNYILSSLKVTYEGNPQFISVKYYNDNTLTADKIVSFYEKTVDDIIVGIDFINNLANLDGNHVGYSLDSITEQDKTEIKDLIDDFNSKNKDFEYYAKNAQVLAYININGKITGYINDSDYKDAVLINENAYNSIAIKEKALYNLMIKISNKRGENISLFEYVLDNEMGLNTYFTDYIDSNVELLTEISKVLAYLNAFIIILVVLLFYSFISSSIKLNKKKVGVLRAMGARQIDTFKIFAWEGSIIALFSMIIAFIVLMIITPLINAFISNLNMVYVSTIVFTFKSIFSMILLTVVITILAITLPLRKFSKLKPIDAIGDK